MSDLVNDSELGRTRHSTSPKDHLFHLLTIGWEPISPLIQRYVEEHGLRRELADWQAGQEQVSRRQSNAKK
jgi:hypothetical protein